MYFAISNSSMPIKILTLYLIDRKVFAQLNISFKLRIILIYQVNRREVRGALSRFGSLNYSET